MSVQEANLRAIADAIREKDGSTAPISANEFPARILAIQGGGDVTLESIAITAPPTQVTYKTGALFDPTGKQKNEKNAANIDYLSMMVGVDLPEGGVDNAQHEI